MNPASAAPAPEPAQSQSGPRSVLPTLATLIAVVVSLIARGEDLVATLHQRATHPDFARAACVFGSSDLAVIMIGLRRGLMRANALYALLARRQAKGRGLPFPRLRRPMPQHPASAQQPALPPDAPGDRPAAAPQRWWENGDLTYLPTQAEVDDEVRRRLPGPVLADICLDLGIYWRHDTALWGQLHPHIFFLGGNAFGLMTVFDQRTGVFPASLLPPEPAPGDKPSGNRARRNGASAPPAPTAETSPAPAAEPSPAPTTGPSSAGQQAAARCPAAAGAAPPAMQPIRWSSSAAEPCAAAERAPVPPPGETEPQLQWPVSRVPVPEVMATGPS